ncbi:unnamed protein product [Adineta steineri]|uniref:Polyketide synthase n=1 Tax=Adineta steineri TaxID=433720 RepID=A0A818JBX4_9BILA|nr:unnamed protein product [Adineta steineri]CAF3533632.1 unnamed protein product [Adineta steineri]
MGSTNRHTTSDCLNVEQNTVDYQNMKTSLEPIAVIGISCVFAGGIDTPESFWNVLKECIDVGGEIPKERFDMDSFAPLYQAKTPLIRRGYFLSNDALHSFDPLFFGITDREAMSMDPCHRILLEKFAHLLEDANYPVNKMYGSRTSVFIGQFTNEHLVTFHRTKVENETNLLGSNLGLYNASARISYHFNLHGPNLTLDTACSSSLQTIHLAVQSLRTGEADFAVAGASNLNYTPENFFSSNIIGAVSPDGKSRSYSEDANGYAKGDGVGLVLLKRLKDAIRDNDKIYCVIQDVMVSHDGCEQKLGYNVPSSYGQKFLLNQIYSRNHVNFNQVFYVEGHGTGTQAGDPIEANTLGEMFNRSPYDPPLLLGSVKSVVGHTEGTAGVASLIKVALCMKHRMITPNMNFSRINPKIQAEKYNLHIVDHIVNFPDESVTIGINNFGFGGNNAHAIVTEWPEQNPNNYLSNSLSNNSTISIKSSSQYFILAFSAKCNQSLQIQIKQILSWLSSIPQQFLERSESFFLTHLCEKVLLQRTTDFSHRLSFIFSNVEKLKQQVEAYLSDENDYPGIIRPQQQLFQYKKHNLKICFIYSGQGPQWWGMGRDLYNNEPTFRKWIEDLNSEFLLVSNNSFSLIDELIKPANEQESNIHLTNVAQPCILSIQIALTSLWISWGIYPNIIIGHSVGEIAAAFVAGQLTLREAVQIIYHRSRVQHKNTNQGGKMLAVFLSENEAKELIKDVEDRVQIAAINSPKSVTLSGDEDVLEQIVNNLSETRPNVYKTWLRVQNAFHSKQMERFNIREELMESLANIKGDSHNHEFDERCSNAILYSTVTGTRTDGLNLDAQYWWENIRNPVLFNKGIQSIFDDINDPNTIPIFIEISPHPVLSTTIIECYQEFWQSHQSTTIQMPLSLYSLNRKEKDQERLLSSLCLLFSNFGSNLVDWNQFWNSRIYSQLLLNIQSNPEFKSIISFMDKLPNYAFNHQICWYESKDSVFSRRATKRKHHPLLGYRLWHNETHTPTWKNVFTMKKDSNTLSYLLDHKIHGDILFPASAFIELVISAIDQILRYISSDQQSITLQNVQFLSGLHLDNDDTIQIETVIIMPFKEFFIYSRRKPVNDSVRLDGISGNDIITTYADESILHKYSSKEWSLHCQGLINLKIDATLISSMYDIALILNRLLPSNNDNSMIIAENSDHIEKLYKYFSECGLTFGPNFRSIKTLFRYKYEALSEVTIPCALCQNINFNKEQYICHPAILDGCFQGIVTIIPGGFSDTFVPVCIDEITLCDRRKSFVSIIEQSNTTFYATQSLNKSVKGLTSDKNFTSDIVIFSKHNQSSISATPVMILQGFKIQNYSNQNIPKSIIQKVQESNSIYNNNPKKTVCVNELTEQFCAYQSWKITEFERNSLNDLIQQSNNCEQFWIIFSDKKFAIGSQIAERLVEFKIKNQNIKLIYYSSAENNSSNRFETISVNDISSIRSAIETLIQSSIYPRNSTLNILFNWSMDLSSENNSIFQDQEQVGCGTLMYLVQTIYTAKFDHYPNIFILTDNSQPMNNNSYHQKNFNFVQSPIIGFARSIMNEYKINRMKLIDLQFAHLSNDLTDALIGELYVTINSLLNSSQNEEIVLSSYNSTVERFVPEYSLIQLPNYQNVNLTKNEIIPKLNVVDTRFQLEVPTSRHISDLQWIHSHNNPRKLSSTEVEIQIHCVSINFRDMLKARGLYPYLRGSESECDNDKVLGADFSGIIVRKGSEAKFNLNDRVFGTTTSESAFKSHIISNGDNIAQAPSNLTMEQLSTLPTYLTVLYCLKNRVQLQRGQTILLHAATSGVGLGFIQYAQMIGANIIATAGTKEKRAFLREKYQIEHVFNSRDLSFVSDVRQVAPTLGVDIVINSLSGKFIEESLKLLAPFGHFIELGKRDIYGKTKFSFFPLTYNCTYHVIDLVSFQKYAPDNIQVLLNDISNLCQNQNLQPITPIKEFDASQIKDAFFQYSQATHIGKFVIKIAASKEKLKVENSQTEEYIQQKRKESVFPVEVCNEGIIVISGGLGGLGIELCKWMINERGVKRVVLLSRKNLGQLDHDSSQFKLWKNLKQIADKNHAIVQAIQTDVTDLKQVLSTFRSINENGLYPIRGIIHSAMVLHDSLLKNMTPNLLSEVMQPKIRGAWNLHLATEMLPCPLHFFIMFSSIRNHIPDVGQSNYNAGNNFLDSLAYWRLKYLHRPAISIGLPAISGAGYLHGENAQSTIQLMEEQGIYMMPANYIFKMVEQLQFIQHETFANTNLFNPVLFVVNWKKLLQANLSSKLVHFGNEFLKIKNENSDKIVLTNDSQELAMTIDAIINKIRLEVSKLFGSLNVDRIDINKPLAQQGMDSLIAVELRSWLLKDMFFNVSLVELVQGMSITDIASYIQNKSLNRQMKNNTITNSNDGRDLSNTTMNTNENSLANGDMNDMIQSKTTLTGTSLIISLHRSDSKSSLFCIHDITGLSHTFIKLALQLKKVYQNDCPSIFAFRASGYEPHEPNFQSIEKIAEQYIFQMKRIQPTGPYYLLGYSFGGLIAYEMVRQLCNKHHATVQSLVLIDPPIPVENIIPIPDEYDEEQFWLLRTIGLIRSYFHKETNIDDIMKQLFNPSLSKDEQNRKLESLIEETQYLLKNQFSTTKSNDQISTKNHRDIGEKKIFEVIKTHVIAKEKYTYESAKIPNESINMKKAIMFTLKENNRYSPRDKKIAVWQSLLSPIQLVIESLDGTHDKLLDEAETIRLIVDQLKQMNII